MFDFERAHKFFRGGTRAEGRLSFGRLTRDDLLLLLADVFNLPLYKQIDSRPSSRPIDCIYTDNEVFWRDALRKKHFQAMRIGLHSFHVMEWLPSAPGRYFSAAAQQSREIAKHDYDYELNEYRPDGKSHMVRGGIGSLRLSAKRIGHDTMYFLGASSTGISHQGIPVALHEADYAQLIRIIHAYGGCVANLVGTLQIFQSSIVAQGSYGPPLQFDPEIPRYCLVVEGVDTVQPSDKSILLATVAITFPQSMDTTITKKAWSYASFYPGSAGSLDTAVEWLKGYVERFSYVRHAPVLTDFDEHYQHFANPVEFPLRDVFSGTIDTDRFEEYKTCWAFDLNTGQQERSTPSQYKIATDDYNNSYEGPAQPRPLPSYIAANVFLSYAHEDEYLVTELKKHLKPLQRQGYINVWYDREIVAGGEREREIEEQLNKAHIILLLVSPDYINSEYCYGVEMPRALERHSRGTAQVIPVILRPVYWQGAPFGALQALPKNAKPVTDPSWQNLDSALYTIAEGVRRVSQQLIATSPIALPVLSMQAANAVQVSPEQSTKPEEFILLRTLVGQVNFVSSLAISSDGQRLVCMGEGAVELWNPHTGQLLHTLTGRSGPIHSVAISPDGKTLVSGSKEGAVAIGPDGKTLVVSGSKEGAIELWNLQTGQFLYALKVRHAHAICEPVISPDGQILLFGDNSDQTIRLWSLRTAEELRSVHIAVEPSCIAVNYDGQSFFSPGPDETIKQWNMQTGELIRTLTGHTHEVRFLATSSDGQRLASGGLGIIKLWDTHTGQLLHTHKSDAYAITCMAISTDGQRLVCRERFPGRRLAERVSLWNLSNWQLLHTFSTPEKSLTSTAIGPDGRLLIWSGAKQGEIEVWGVASSSSRG